MAGIADHPIHWGEWNLAAALESARSEADDLASRAGKQAHPESAKLYLYTLSALGAACAIAHLSRNPTAPTLMAFVYSQTRLDECFGRAVVLVDKTEVLRRWPKTPGTTFLTHGGDSAMEAVLRVVRGICTATEIARTKTVGFLGHKPPDLRVSLLDSDPKIIAWRDATVKELLEHTLPPPPACPSHEIRREQERVESLLSDEYGRAMAQRAAGKPDAKHHAEITPSKPRRGRLPKADSEAIKMRVLVQASRNPSLANNARALAKLTGTKPRNVRRILKKENEQYKAGRACHPEDEGTDADN